MPVGLAAAAISARYFNKNAAHLLRNIAKEWQENKKGWQIERSQIPDNSL